MVFVALAVVVDHGSVTRLDQHAVSHLMPWLRPPFDTGVDASQLVVPQTGPTLAATLVSLLTYPAGVLPSGLVLAFVALLLRRRGLTRAAVAWPAVWLAGNLVEVVGKGVLVRPALYSHGVHVTPFDQSYPSGHALRGLLLAAAVAWTWRRAWPLLVWALAVPFALVALGGHTPSDVVGGVLAALALVAAALAVVGWGQGPARWTISPSTTVSSTGSSGSSSGSQATGSSARTVRSAA